MLEGTCGGYLTQPLSQSKPTFTRALSNLTQSPVTQLRKTAGLLCAFFSFQMTFSREHVQGQIAK